MPLGHLCSGWSGERIGLVFRKGTLWKKWLVLESSEIKLKSRVFFKFIDVRKSTNNELSVPTVQFMHLIVLTTELASLVLLSLLLSSNICCPQK